MQNVPQPPLQPPLHALVQLSEQLLEQWSAQPPSQPDWQLLAQAQPEMLLELATEDTAGMLANAITPKMGRALLAAFLKNSLRDWSSALFLLFFITLKVKMPMNSQIRR